MRFVPIFASLILALTAGCSALVDSTLSGRPGPDAGNDAFVRDVGPTDASLHDSGPASPCAGQPDGIHCTMEGLAEPFVCVHGVCQLSRCGDGVVDMRVGSMHAAEECDDGNSMTSDGCEPACTFSCHANADCDDMLLCNGAESCDTMHTHACQPGMAATDGTICTVMMTPASCQGGVCRAGVCGNGMLEPGELCDDHNTMDGDGCQHDCTFTCVMDADCQDGNACNGNETCMVSTHTCHAATAPLDCNDMDPCTNDTCDMAMGCVNASVLVDMDMDTHFAITTSCGGDDCDDNNMNAFPGANEPCGSTQDLNCDGHIGTPPTWFADCDGDGYAPLGATSMTSCNAPTTGPSTCTSGHWTSSAPNSRVHDCLDTNSSAHPGQSGWFTSSSGLSPAFDFNCDGIVEYEYLGGNPPAGETTSCAWTTGGIFSFCSGNAYYPNGRPACGASATFSHCVASGSFCLRSATGTAVEACH